MSNHETCVVPCMRTLSDDEPFDSEVVTEFIPINGARSIPAFGDVAWQAVFK